jgi:hypothetical protein
VGEEREREEGRSAEVYIVFGKIQGARGGQRPPHELTAHAGHLSPLPLPAPVAAAALALTILFGSFLFLLENIFFAGEKLY